MGTSAKRFCVLIALLCGCAAVGLFGHGAASGQSPAAARPEVGRYQMTHSGSGSGSGGSGGSGALVLLDTATGRCWRKHPVPNPGTDDEGWGEISPAWAKGK